MDVTGAGDLYRNALARGGGAMNVQAAHRHGVTHADGISMTPYFT